MEQLQSGLRRFLTAKYDPPPPSKLIKVYHKLTTMLKLGTCVKFQNICCRRLSLCSSVATSLTKRTCLESQTLSSLLVAAMKMAGVWHDFKPWTAISQCSAEAAKWHLESWWCKIIFWGCSILDSSCAGMAITAMVRTLKLCPLCIQLYSGPQVRGHQEYIESHMAPLYHQRPCLVQWRPWQGCQDGSVWLGQRWKVWRDTLWGAFFSAHSFPSDAWQTYRVSKVWREWNWWTYPVLCVVRLPSDIVWNSGRFQSSSSDATCLRIWSPSPRAGMHAQELMWSRG